MPSQKSILLLSSFAALLVVGFCAFLFIHLEHKAPSPIESNQPAPDPEDADGWKAFGDLVHGTQKFKNQKPAPAWICWSNKCNAGIQSDCLLESNAKTHILPSDLRAMAYPTQALARIEAALGPGGKLLSQRNRLVTEFVQAPQMASVLFDPLATGSLLKLNLKTPASLTTRISQLDGMTPPATGTDRTLMEGTFAPDSTAIKLIWEVVPDAGSAPSLQKARIFNSTNKPISPGGMSLNPVAEWNPPVKLDTSDPQRDCPDKLDPNATSFPISCFFYYHIGGYDDPLAEQEIDELNNDGKNVIGDLPNTNSYVILVGVHMMRLTANHPNWVWSTYYLTAENNQQQGWYAPWTHFHMMTTSAIRNDTLSLDTPHNVAYSPYLEGTAQPNGLTANCLNCHTFAAYSPSGSKQGAGVAYGEQYKFFPSDIQAAEQDYFRGSVQTAFIWSIADSQDQSAMSTARTLLNLKFQSEHPAARRAAKH